MTMTEALKEAEILRLQVRNKALSKVAVKAYLLLQEVIPRHLQIPPRMERAASELRQAVDDAFAGTDAETLRKLVDAESSGTPEG
jgi:hypothetical protein